MAEQRLSRIITNYYEHQQNTKQEYWSFNMFFTHYCLGTHVDHYLHKGPEDEECEPKVLLFESRDIAHKFRELYAPSLKVFEVSPLDVFDDEFDAHDCWVILCVDVRDREVLTLDLTFWELFDRQQHSNELDLDAVYGVIPLPHRQSQDPATDADVTGEGQGASSV
jgi:hypothetical protein